MRTYTVRMINITLSADEHLVQRARRVAQQQGTTLNALMRRYLETLAGKMDGAQAADELLELMRSSGGNSKGWRWRRDDAYEGRP